jgi:hypothetical protein
MRFRPGDAVRVRGDTPARHHRTPGYVKGKVGRVEAVRGRFRNPESLAQGGDGLPETPLYQVGFDQAALWSGYAGDPRDRLFVDLYEHWLEPAAGG